MMVATNTLLGHNMAAFNYEWDDFRGGYYVGPSDVNQPKNTWKGANITLSDDDATLVPTYEPQTRTLSGVSTSGGKISNGATATTWSDPTYFNGYVVLVGRTSSAATIYFINTATNAVQAIGLGAAGTVCGGAPVIVPVNGDLVAYVVIGTTNIYQITRSSGAVATFLPGALGVIGITAGLTNLTIWNARMIAWSTSTDYLVFSEALNFGINWPALNYITVGYANDGISYCIPRNIDMVVVKPSGWYSITGVMGANTSVRQMNDTLGILPVDPAAQHNNAIYFTTSTGSNNYAVNLLAISGSRVDVAAYQRFGVNDANLRIARTNMGYLAVVALVEDYPAAKNAVCYLFDPQERWQVFKIPAVSSYSDAVRFAFARGQVSRYNTTEDQNLYLCEYTNGSSNTVTLRSLRPNTIEPGKLSASSAPASATLKLADISTKTPTIIRRVYVEAEMMQIPSSPYTGSASIQARVNNKAVGDKPFSQTIGDVSSNLSIAYTYPYSDFTSVTNTIYSQVRVLRFNVDDATYGYVNEIELQFSGLRIRRVWVEGDSR